MPIRESIGLAKDSVVQNLLVNIPPPPEPPPEDPIVTLYPQVAWKNYPKWFDADDTYNGDTSWLSGGPTTDRFILAKYNGSTWDQIMSVDAGVWDRNAQPSGHPSPISVGDIGNWWISPDPDNGTTGYTYPSFDVHSGDQLAILGYKDTTKDNNWGSNWGTNPSIHLFLYSDSGHSSLAHEFDELDVPVTLSPLSHGTPFTGIEVYVGTPWNVP